MKNSNVLITDATHFIGSHLIEQLVPLDCRVKALVRYNYYYNWGALKYLPVRIRNGIEMISGDIRNPEVIEYATKGADIVFHLSTIDAIPSSHVNLRDLLESNIMGTLNVLNAAKAHGIQKLVYVSTGDVYGDVKDSPIDETQPSKALSPQIAACIGAENLVEGFHSSEGLPVVITRLFNPYGPAQTNNAIIPTIVAQGLIESKLYLGNMHAIRDFVFIEDVVDGLLKAAESPKSVGETINLGTGEGTSIGDLAEKILDFMGRKIEILFDATRIRPQNYDIERLIADTTKAKSLLGWQPCTSLEDGLQQTIDWFSEHLDIGQIARN